MNDVMASLVDDHRNNCIEKPANVLDRPASTVCMQAQSPDNDSTNNSLKFLIARARIEASKSNKSRNKPPLSTQLQQQRNGKSLQWSEVQQLIEESQTEAIKEVAGECLSISLEQDASNQAKKRSPSPNTHFRHTDKIRRLAHSVSDVSDDSLPIVSPVANTAIRIPPKRRTNRDPRDYFAMSRLMCSDSSLNTTDDDEDEKDCFGSQHRRMELSASDALDLQQMQEQSASSGMSLEQASTFDDDDDASILSEDLKSSALSGDADDGDDDSSIAFSIDSVCMRKQQMDSQSSLSMAHDEEEAPIPQIEFHEDVEEHAVESSDEAVALQSWFRIRARLGED